MIAWKTFSVFIGFYPDVIYVLLVSLSLSYLLPFLLQAETARHYKVNKNGIKNLMSVKIISLQSLVIVTVCFDVDVYRCISVFTLCSYDAHYC